MKKCNTKYSATLGPNVPGATSVSWCGDCCKVWETADGAPNCLAVEDVSPTAWLFDPRTGERRSAEDVGADPMGHTFRDGGQVKKAFWSGFEIATCTPGLDIESRWNEYKKSRGLE